MIRDKETLKYEVMDEVEIEETQEAYNPDESWCAARRIARDERARGNEAEAQKWDRIAARHYAAAEAMIAGGGAELAEAA